MYPPCASLRLLTSHSQPFPPCAPSLGRLKSALCVCEFVSVSQVTPSVSYFRSHMQGVSPSLPNFLYLSLLSVSVSLRPHGLQHTRLCCPVSQTLLKFTYIESGMPPNHLILCCPLFSCPQSFPASEFFPMSQLFASGDQSIEASASVLPTNIQS